MNKLKINILNRNTCGFVILNLNLYYGTMQVILANVSEELFG